jgi:catechol 2,3-dioxygenase-like lactoylglutathione lyase family enzyme
MELTRRQMLALVPAAAVAPRLLAQTPAPTIRLRTLNHFQITVSDVKRSIDFYQTLFGMPVQARSDTATLLRIGSGPQFLSIAPVAAGAAPAITHFCFGVDGFNLDRVLAVLAQHGVTKSDTPGPMKAVVTKSRDGRQDLLFGDPDGVQCQLQDVSYCGGTGALGNVCSAPEPSPKKGLIALKDLSHLTVFSSDGARSNMFYQDLFGMPVRSYQGPVGVAPALGIGPKVQFIMFAGGGGPRGGGGGRAGGAATPAAPPAPRPAAINHACMNLEGFKPDDVIKTLESVGIRKRESEQGAVGPLRHYISLRMPNRGGAEGGTPELYFTDPDGLLMQLQDTTYCGGAGYLGEVCRG